MAIKEKYLAMLNTTYKDGSVAEITAATLLKNAAEGEVWFNHSKPNDGTHVDYTLYKLLEIRNM